MANREPERYSVCPWRHSWWATLWQRLRICSSPHGGHLPGRRLQSSEGRFDKRGRYAGTKGDVTKAFGEVYSSVPIFEAQFGIAYADGQTGPLWAQTPGTGRTDRLLAVDGDCQCVVYRVRRYLQFAGPPAPAPLFLGFYLFVLFTLLYAYWLRRSWRYVAECVVADVLR
jgi:hypothetical protein